MYLHPRHPHPEQHQSDSVSWTKILSSGFYWYPEAVHWTGWLQFLASCPENFPGYTLHILFQPSVRYCTGSLRNILSAIYFPCSDPQNKCQFPVLPHFPDLQAIPSDWPDKCRLHPLPAPYSHWAVVFPFPVLHRSALQWRLPHIFLL